MKKITLCLALCFVQGCATSPTYYKQYDGQSLAKEDVATVESESIIGTLGYGYVSPYIIKVDDKPCKPDYPMCEAVELLPGKYNIKIGVENIRYYSDAFVELTVEAGQEFVIKSEEIKPDYNAPIKTDNIWIINKKGLVKVKKVEGWSQPKLKPPVNLGPIYISM